jgi:hypothetical protein
MRRLALVAVLGALGPAGCGGAPVDQSRAVPAFDRLDVTGGIRVAVVRGARPAVTVHGRKDVINRVDTTVSGGRLRVAVHDRGIVIGSDPMDDVLVRVTAPRLGDVQIEGSGNVDLGDVTTRSLHFAIDGAGEVTARGQVDSLTAVIHGAGGADFSRLAARDARVEIHGAAGVQLDVTQRLDVEIQGAGDVRYTGHPRVTKTISGAGDVRQILP